MPQVEIKPTLRMDNGRDPELEWVIDDVRQHGNNNGITFETQGHMGYKTSLSIKQLYRYHRFLRTESVPQILP